MTNAFDIKIIPHNNTVNIKAILTPCRKFFYEGFTMVVYEKIYFKTYTNDQNISHKINIVQLYFILGTAGLQWNFSGILKDGFDIHRFSNRKCILTMCTDGNL